MQKKHIRNLINHYGYRWDLLRHNRNRDQKVLTVHDAALLEWLLPGSTLGLDFINHQYQGIIPNLQVDNPGVYDNVIMLNAVQLKYKTLHEIGQMLGDVSHQSRQRLILGFNFQFLKFNRLKNDFTCEIGHWLDSIRDQDLHVIYTLMKKIPNTNPYGDCIFIFDKKSRQS